MEKVEKKIMFIEIDAITAVKMLSNGEEKKNIYFLTSTGDLGQVENYRINFEDIYRKRWFRRCAIDKETHENLLCDLKEE